MANDFTQSLTNVDQNLLLYLNGFRNTFADYFMNTFTEKWIWMPMYASTLYILSKNLSWKITLYCLAAVAPTTTFADQVHAGLIRPAVERLRPANPRNPISDLVHIVNSYRGGHYGSPPCHTSSSFELAFFLVFLFYKQWLSLFILLWTTLNCCTRIYPGVYYPGDLAVGAIVGCCGAVLMCYLLRRIAKGISSGKVKHTEIVVHTGLLTTLGILTYASIAA